MANENSKLQRTRGRKPTYSDREKREVAIHYAITGVIRKAADATGVHESTIRYWMQQDWWQDLLQEHAEEIEARVRADFDRVIEKATAETIDRLENGDVVLGKNGELKRIPVKARDAMTIGAIAYDKRRISLNLPTSISSSGTKQVEELAKQFHKLAESFSIKNARDEEAIEGELLE